MVKADMITSLKLVLKEKKYKKIRNYWYKVQNGMTFYLNIQGSAYSSDDFYVNLGCMLSLFNGKIPPIYEWDICRRVFVDGKQTNLELEEVMGLADRILVIYEGEIVGELNPKETNPQELGLYMSGAKRQGKEAE